MKGVDAETILRLQNHLSTEVAAVEGPDSTLDGTEQLFAGRSHMDSLMRAFDWTRTPLGLPEHWPPTLRMMTKMLLANRFPMLLWWGPDFLQIYNDAYAPILGAKHPTAALGKPFRECWAEVYSLLGPLAQTPYEGGPATWVEDILCEVNRYGFVEETHFTIAYSPVPAEELPSGIGGVLATVQEITEKVVGERRGRLLRDIGLSGINGYTAERACARVAETFDSYPKDTPFALIYLTEPHRIARLVGSAGLEAGTTLSPETISIDDGNETLWNLGQVFETGRFHRIDLRDVEGVPAGPWSDPPREAAVLPIASNAGTALAGFLVVGLSPRLAFDESYENFLELAADRIAAIVATARAREEERKRAEALAEVDRVKTIFFSNVSHEFRTPLTLIMGPLQEAADDSSLPAHLRDSLDVARRNSLRLRKLVNNLLEFSRIEAGKAQAIFEPVDLALFTEELASGFRSAFEKAGLWLRISIDDLHSPVYVDREMWEKIVLNLLSNALKFTLVGGVTVELREHTGFAQLVISDTGIGIAAPQLTRIFGRFERIEGAGGRSSEGTGIGLALVQELVKLHRGSVSVDSEEGVGTSFTVRLPIDKDRVSSGASRHASSVTSQAGLTEAFVLEALDWAPRTSQPSLSTTSDELPDGTPNQFRSKKRKRILVADDNVDMRRYISRLLEGRFAVETVTTGVEALARIDLQRPDLVLSDVMMPGMDGLSLLRAIRGNPETSSLPIILLSARAGEQAAIEGLQTGADDYLVKPFSSSELVARVGSVLEISEIRSRAAESLRAEQSRLLNLFRQAPVFITVLRGPEHIFEMTNPLYDELIGNRNVIGKTVREAVPEAVNQGFVNLLDQVYRSGEMFRANGLPVDLARIDGGPLERRYLDFVYQPMRDQDGGVNGIIAVGIDVTTRKATETDLNVQRDRFSFATGAAGVGYWFCDLPFAELIWDHRVKQHFWLPPEARVTIDTFYQCIHPDDRERTRQAIEASIATKTTYDTTYRTVAPDGRHKWIRAIGRTAYGEDGQPTRFDGITMDVTHQKQSEEALLRNEKLAVVGRMAASISHEINNPLEAVMNLLYLIRTEAGSSETLTSFAHQAEEELTRVSQIVTHTLQFNRQSSAPEEQSVNMLLESAVAIYSARMSQMGIRLVRDFRAQNPIFGMQSEIRQVLSNLIGNAFDAMKRGGTLTLRTRDSVDWKTDHAGIRVTIADTGHGMDENTIRHLFDPFFTTKGMHGTGLGLWISAEILRRHNSTVRVKSRPQWRENHGTLFSIFFPCSDDDCSAGSSPIDAHAEVDKTS